MNPVPAADSGVRASGRLDELARAFAILRRETEKPLPARIADAARAVAGARRAAVYLRERDRWLLAFDSAEGAAPTEPPASLFEGAVRHGDLLWVALDAEGETHGCLGLEGLEGDDPAVMRITEATRSTIQAMLDRMLAERR